MFPRRLWMKPEGVSEQSGFKPVVGATTRHLNSLQLHTDVFVAAADLRTEGNRHAAAFDSGKGGASPHLGAVAFTFALIL